MKTHFEKMLLTAALAGLSTLGSVAMAQGTLVENFEGATLAAEVMFQEAGFSGSTTGINAANDLSEVVNTQANDILDPAAGSVGTQSYRIFAEWSGASGGAIRATSSSVVTRPNPRVDLTLGVGFYVKITQGQCDLALHIRETVQGGGTTGTIGDNAGTTGGIERSTTRTLDSAANSDWQYVYFNLPSETWTAFAGATANGILEGSQGSIESLRLVQTGGAGNLEIFVDDFYNGAAQTPQGGGDLCPTDSVVSTVTVDGTKDADYGTILATQTTNTEFGNASSGNLQTGGSELDGLFITNDGLNLYLMFTGNIETNGNGIAIFLDTVEDTTGVSTLPNIAGSKDGFFDNTDGFGSAIMPTGFNADMALVYKGFDFPDDNNLDFVAIRADFRGTPVSDFTPDTPIATSALDAPGPAIASFTLGGQSYSFAINNSNIAGVDGATPYPATGNPAAITTGFEIAIPLAALGASVGDSVQVFGLITNGSFGGNTYLANQVLPGLATPRGNLAGTSDAPFVGAYNFSATGVPVTAACYTLKAAPLAAEKWEMYE